jgi:protein-L-isoaspartate(D-aspartate) O-methyltransferase
MGSVPRHLFVSEGSRNEAYDDHPLPIGHEQTISQPYIVALMTQLAQPKPGHRALDVGTGSGYQAAVLSLLCKEVYGIEIVPPLAEAARTRLAELGYANVTVRSGDGYRGWPEHAPFDVIIVAAAPDHVPQALVDQLAPGGRLVIPVGGYTQHLTVIERQADGSIRRSGAVGVLFVPMTGEALKRGSPDGER